MKKLMLLTVTYEALCWVENEREAESFLDEVIRDASDPLAAATDLRPFDLMGKRHWPLPEGWTQDSLVYHKDPGDLPVADVLPLHMEYMEQKEKEQKEAKK